MNARDNWVKRVIRTAAIADLPEICAIYNQAVATGFSTADLDHVSVESRINWFKDHDSSQHPIFVFEDGGEIKGWCSLSPYRPNRRALRHTAEISYYVRMDSQRRGIATNLISHALSSCEALQIRNVIAIVLDRNVGSRCLLEKTGFVQWGFLPQVADFAGEECGHIYYGLRLPWAKQGT